MQQEGNKESGVFEDVHSYETKIGWVRGRRGGKVGSRERIRGGGV